MTRGQENVDEEHERSPGVPLANLEELRGNHRALREVHNNHLAVDIFAQGSRGPGDIAPATLEP